MNKQGFEIRTMFGWWEDLQFVVKLREYALYLL